MTGETVCYRCAWPRDLRIVPRPNPWTCAVCGATNDERGAYEVTDRDLFGDLT